MVVQFSRDRLEHFPVDAERFVEKLPENECWMVAVAEDALRPPFLVTVQAGAAHDAFRWRPGAALHHQHTHAVGPVEESRIGRAQRHAHEIDAQRSAKERVSSASSVRPSGPLTRMRTFTEAASPAARLAAER